MTDKGEWVYDPYHFESMGSSAPLSSSIAGIWTSDFLHHLALLNTVSLLQTHGYGDCL